jgi:hypothetical protein
VITFVCPEEKFTWSVEPVRVGVPLFNHPVQEAKSLGRRFGTQGFDFGREV